MPLSETVPGGGIKFNSKLVPPYSEADEERRGVHPLAVPEGISTGEMQPALERTTWAEGAKGLSAATVSRLPAFLEAADRGGRQTLGSFAQ